uniref:Zinc finger BED domain-containing protein 5 n=1 Tax=Caligus rogercresseyi TaxID=217165 RepID=C1BP00_CALRO|nr:Zinc finger BED domain-containing protein 5 [Caligus rogercresseyi]
MDKWLKRLKPPSTETPQAPTPTTEDVGDIDPDLSPEETCASSNSETAAHQATSMASASDRGGDDEPPSTSKHMGVEMPTSVKRRKYDDKYIALGFTCIGTGSSIQPQCVVCAMVLSHNSMKPSLLRRHLETNHPHLKNKPREYFERELHGLSITKSTITKLTNLKTKYRHRLCVEDDLRLKLSPIRPDIQGLCASSQAHTPH